MKLQFETLEGVETMKLISSKIEQRSKLALLAVGALIVAPLFSAQTAKAAPPAHAPAWGYRDKNRDNDRSDTGRKRDKNRDKDRDWNRNRDNDPYCDDGHNQNNGGWHNGGYGGGYGNHNSYTITGVVTKEATGNQFWVRADNGQGYLVSTRYQSAVISTGMRVQVTGSFDGTRLNADSVRVLGYAGGNGGYGGGNGGYGGGNGGYGGGYGGGNGGGYQGGWNNGGNEVNFPGYIQSVSYSDGASFLQVRGDNGQIYSVRYRGNNALRRGARVRVIGKYNEGTVWATSVR